MKKFLVAILIICTLAFVGCGGEKKEASVKAHEKIDKTAESLVDLSKLEESGWKEIQNGYELNGHKDGCKYHYTVSVEKDVMHLELQFEYDAGNDSIIKMYKEDDIIASGISAMWFEDISAIIGKNIGTLKYKVIVGKTTVGEGTLTDDEAESIAAEYDS